MTHTTALSYSHPFPDHIVDDALYLHLHFVDVHFIAWSPFNRHGFPVPLPPLPSASLIPLTHVSVQVTLR